MKSTVLLAAGATAATAASAKTPGDYLTWAADSFLLHKPAVPTDYHYTTAVLYDGYQAAYNLTKNETYADWSKSQIDGNVVLANGSINDWNMTYYSLDDYRMANNFLWWYNRTGEEKYKTAASIVREQLNRHPQNAEGGFMHRYPIYTDQQWLDGIFMADSFYARWTAQFDADNTTAWDHIVLQFENIEKHCRNETTGLLVHGYDESKTAVWADPITGAAPNVWSRAVGWYFIALLEVIPLIPTAHAGYAKLLEYYTTLAAAIKAHQDEKGGWWLIMNDPYVGAEGNYIESSASAMFTYGLLKGIADGYIADAEYYASAEKGYNLLIEDFVVENKNGTINYDGTVAVGSLSGNGTYEVCLTCVNDHLNCWEWEANLLTVLHWRPDCH